MAAPTSSSGSMAAMVASSSKSPSVKQSRSTVSNSADSERTRRGSAFSLTSHSKLKEEHEEEHAGDDHANSARPLASSSSDHVSSEDHLASLPDRSRPASHASVPTHTEDEGRRDGWSDREKLPNALPNESATPSQSDTIWVEWQEGGEPVAGVT